MLQGKLYRGDALSVAEEVLRDSLIILRDKLISDMASEQDSSKLVLYQAKAWVLEQLSEEAGKIIKAANPVQQIARQKLREQQ